MSVVDEVQAARAAFNKAVKDARNSDQLSALAVQQRLAKAWLVLRDELAAIKQRSDEAARMDRRRIEAELFQLDGDPTASISWRDALDRAEQALSGNVDDEPGRAMLDRARVSNDPLLAKAVLTVAVQRRRRGLVDAFCEAFPDDAALALDYLEVVSPTENRLGAFALKMAFSPPPKPAEIAHLNPSAMTQLTGGTAGG